MQMRIRCHFLADLNVRKRAWNRSEKRIRNTLSKSKSWTSYKPKSWLSHIRALIFLYIYHCEFTDGFVQTSTNTFESIRTLVEVRNYAKSESFSKVQGRERLIFHVRVTTYIDFPNKWNDYLLASVFDSFLLVISVNEGDSSRPAPTRVHVPWMLFLTKYDKIL